MRQRTLRQVSTALGFCLVVLSGFSGGALAAPAAVNSPVRVVHVSWGRIGYRAIGTGPPLVLVTGYSDSIDGWAPGFLDLLARNHRVFALDNEGIGRTTLRAGPLTISRMGDDVADFIAALHLGQTDVLGWSMGGYIVQALAVRHPASVRRIVLCATLPGDGSATASSIPVRTSPPFANFFPPDKDSTRLAFIRDIHRYRGFYMAPAAVVDLQATASQAWIAGQEPPGNRLGRIRATALVADGSEDPLDALANSETLEREIPHAQLQIYPDAAHGFWFQDRENFVRRINRFLR